MPAKKSDHKRPTVGHLLKSKIDRLFELRNQADHLSEYIIYKLKECGVNSVGTEKVSVKVITSLKLELTPIDVKDRRGEYDYENE